MEINSSVQNWIEELEEEFQVCVNPMEVYYNQAKKLIYTFGGKQALGKFLTEKVSLLRTVRVSQDIEIQYQIWNDLPTEMQSLTTVLAELCQKSRVCLLVLAWCYSESEHE